MDGDFGAYIIKFIYLKIDTFVVLEPSVSLW